MNTENNYIEINRQSWNNRTETHLKSEFYGLDNFLKGKSSLNDIELILLRNVKGKTILHLQDILGHSDLKMTMRYTSIKNETKDNALDALVE